MQTSKKYTYKLFETILRQLETIPLFEREYMFSKERKWRIDFAFPEHKLAVEIEGGIFSNGRHTRGSGFLKDIEKYNEMALQGWTLLRFTPSQLETYAIDCIERFFQERR